MSKYHREILDVAAMPVAIVHSPEEQTSLGVEFGGTNQFSVPLSGSIVGAPFNGVQILQRRPNRYKAVVTVQSLTTSFLAVNQIPLGATGVATFNNNSVGVFVTISGGTVSQINIGGTNTNLTSGTFFVPPGNTVTVTYTVAPTMTTAFPAGVAPAASVATAVVLTSDVSTFSNPNNPIGFVIAAAPYTFQWENQQPCYAIALGSGPVTVSVIDQMQAGKEAEAEEYVQSYGINEEDMQEGGGIAAETGAGNLY